MSQGSPAPVFGVFSAVSAISGTAHAGTPVYPTSESKLGAAFDNDDTVSACVGLLARPCAEGDIGAVVTCGPLTLEKDQWNQVIGDETPDGLTPGAAYYLNDDAGKISSNQPDGAPVTRVGIAASAYTMIVSPGGPNDINAS